MILQLMKYLYAHDVIDYLPLSVFLRLYFLERNYFQKQDMVPCEAFWHMDNTSCNVSKIGSKIIAIRFCETFNRKLKACIALKPEGNEKWKSRNSINSDQLCLTSMLDIFLNCTENENWQIFKFTVFTIFFSSKAWYLPKTLKILFFVLYDITYIQTTGNDNNYLNVPIN